MTETTDLIEGSFALEVKELDKGNLKIVPLGLSPFVLLLPTHISGDSYRISVVAGGGAVVQDLDTFLDHTANLLREPDFIKQWAKKIGQQESEDSNE